MYQQYKSPTTQGLRQASKGKKTDSQRGAVQATAAAMQSASKHAKKTQRAAAPERAAASGSIAGPGSVPLSLRRPAPETPEDTLKRLQDDAAKEEKKISEKPPHELLVAYTALGKQVAQSLPPPGEVRPFEHWPWMTTVHVQRFCGKSELRHLTPASIVDILHYVPVGEKPVNNDARLPVVFLHKNNAVGCDSFKLGQHGFVWTFTPPGRQNFPEGRFNLFCSRDLVTDQLQVPKHCVYRGVYIAHHLDVYLPARAWRELPESDRMVAGRIRYDSYPKSMRPEKVEDEIVRFERGIHQARLVILQFVRVGDKVFDKELKAACKEILTPLKRTGWKSIPSPQDLGPEYVKIHASMNAGKSQNKRAC